MPQPPNPPGKQPTPPGSLPEVHVSTASRGPSKSATAKRTTALWITAGLAAFAIVPITWFVWSRTRESPSPSTDVISEPSQAPNEAPLKAVPLSRAEPSDHGGEDSRYRIVKDGEALWMPPTEGQPMTLAGLPAGVRCLLQLNLASVDNSRQAGFALRAMGPNFFSQIEGWQQAHQINLADHDQLLLAWYTSSREGVRLIVRGRPKRDWSIPSEWRPIGSNTPSERFRVGASLARVFDPFWVLGPADLVEPLADATTSPPLQRQLEALRQRSDSDRQLILLVSVPFLWAHGETAFGGESAHVLDYLEQACGDRIDGALLMIHTEDDGQCHMELQSTVRAGKDMGLGKMLDDAISHATAIANGLPDIDPYWSSLRERFPTMLSFVGRQIRAKREGRVSVANVSLPPAALHNLILGREMMIATAGAASEVTGVERQIDASHLLQQPLNYSFEQESLVRALEGLQEEAQRSLGTGAPFSIRVDDAALKIEGITRNQQITNFRFVDAPIRTVLTAIVERANPAKVDSTADPGQKLIWVLTPDEHSGDSTVILITTRAQAVARSWEIPAEFTNP